MSRKDGSGGDSSMPRVMTDSVTADPRSSRICHSVCTQISPSACTSGTPAISPRSAYVYPPGPTPGAAFFGQFSAPVTPTGQSIAALRNDTSSPPEYRNAIASPTFGVSVNQP